MFSWPSPQSAQGDSWQRKRAHHPHNWELPSVLVLGNAPCPPCTTGKPSELGNRHPEMNREVHHYVIARRNFPQNSMHIFSRLKHPSQLKEDGSLLKQIQVVGTFLFKADRSSGLMCHGLFGPPSSSNISLHIVSYKLLLFVTTF